MIIDESQLCAFILDSHLVSKADFEDAHAEAESTGRKVADVLVTSGKITEGNLRKMEAHVLGMKFVELAGVHIPFEILKIIPEVVTRNSNVVAFAKTPSGAVEVAVLDTDDLSAIDFLVKNSAMKVIPRLTDTESMKSAIVQYQRALKKHFGDALAKELKSVTADSAAQIFELLARHALTQNVSDMYIEPTEKDTLIRYRVGGVLYDALMLPKNNEQSIIAYIKKRAHLKTDESRMPQNGKFELILGAEEGVPSEQISFRLATAHTLHGERVSVRLTRDSSLGFSLETAGFHGDAREKIHRALQESSGIVMVAGPARSGKTTTLYTFLDILNSAEVSISTIEDPIGYHLKRCNQMQVRAETGLTFVQGLRAVLRQDPDVVMVGDMADAETLSLAEHASSIGKHIFTSIETTSAAEALVRLRSMTKNPRSLAANVCVVIGQRLVPRIFTSDTQNLEKYFLNRKEIDQLHKVADLDRVLETLKSEKIVDEKVLWDKIPLWKCSQKSALPETNESTEKISLYEVLQVSPAIKELIVQDASAQEISKQARYEGMLTMIEDGLYKCVLGQTTLEDVLKCG